MLVLTLAITFCVFNASAVALTREAVDCSSNTTQETLYGTGVYPYSLITIDTGTGAWSLVGPTGTSYCVWGLEFDSRSDTLYGVTNDDIDVFGNSRLVRIDRTTGAATPVGGLVGSRVDGLAYDPANDRLYGADNYGNLVAIDASTGTGTIVGYTGFPSIQGLAFNTIDGRLYGVNDFQLVSIDPLTGIGTVVASISPGWAAIRGLSFARSGALYGAWDAANGTSCLVTIDMQTGQVSLVGLIGFGVEGLAFAYPVSKPVHNVNTSLDYSLIQQAIDAPETLNGHTIVVDAGTYMENVRVNKGVNIVSRDGPSVTIVNASRNSTQNVFYLDTINDVSISGFTATGTSANAIYLFKANNTLVSNSYASNNNIGILLESCSNNTIFNNTANLNSGAGIYLNSSSSNTIFENDVRMNYIGIVVRANSTNNTLRLNNAASNSRCGIYLFTSSGNNLTENNSTGNVRDGIVLDNSQKNNLIANNVMNSGRYGLVFVDSSNNALYHNNFVNNTIQVYDVSWNSSSYNPSINVWDNGYPSGGNYWSDYVNQTSIQELSYDDGASEGSFWFTGPGPIAAVRFTSPATGRLMQCRFEVWNVSTTVKIHVMNADKADIITPFDVTPTLDIWNSVDLSGLGVTVSTGVDLYIGIEWVTAYTRINYDASSIDNRSWFQLNGIWTQWTGGDYLIRTVIETGMDTNGDGIGDTPYVIDGNNQDRFPLITLWISPRDVAITALASCKTVVWQGCCTTVNVTVVNQGNYTETFNVTFYANTTALQTQQVFLTSGNSTILTFTWNATGFTRGKYTLNAYAWPIADETDLADNSLMNGQVIVAMVGDITGMGGYPDGRCNMVDIGTFAANFNLNMPPAPANCDVTGLIPGVPDGRINMRDISLVASNFGMTSPPP